MQFNKPAQTHQEHLDLLKNRGLIIDDEDRFYKYIKTIGYYRLTGYMYPLQVSDGKHNFKPNISFDFIISHYLFDKKLRLLLLYEIERIEIAIRAIICNTYALKYGPHWYTDSNHFNSAKLHNDLISDVTKYCKDTSDLFIKNYNFKYTHPQLPASWMVFEILTFGQLASLYENLKDTDEKKHIASEFNTVVSLLESWLKSINYIRNCCAHHTRLWNKKIPLKPTIPTSPARRFLMIVDDETNKRIYGVISCILFLNNKINPRSTFKKRIKKLFDEYPTINKEYMGFHSAWEDEPIWQ